MCGKFRSGTLGAWSWRPRYSSGTAGLARDLPWRAADATPWAILVSEIMLQQTPVARVEPVYRAWLARWPTPADLARAGPGDAVRMWGSWVIRGGPCGFGNALSC